MRTEKEIRERLLVLRRDFQSKTHEQPRNWSMSKVSRVKQERTQETAIWELEWVLNDQRED
jgi:hypothetical protein